MKWLCIIMVTTIGGHSDRSSNSTTIETIETRWHADCMRVGRSVQAMGLERGQYRHFKCVQVSR